MQKKCKILFAVLPLIAMTAASGTFIRSLFYNFRNDTVPLFSFGISIVLTMICLVLLFITVVCAILYLHTGIFQIGNRAEMLAAACILNLGFGIFCAVIKQSHFVIITVYLLLTSLSFALSYAFFRREQKTSGNHEKTEDFSQ